MTMKKLVLFAFMTVVVISVMGAETENLVPQSESINVMSAVVNDEGDVDLYLECFENAVKVKDMELAAKIANVLYGMEMNIEQQKRFTKIEDMISKKDYRVYRDYLNRFSAKSMTVYDDYNSEMPYDDAHYNSGIDDGYSVVDEIDEMIDAFTSFFSDLGVTDSSSYHYERHDTLDNGGFVDVLVDSFGKYWLDDGSQSKRSDVDDAEIDNLLDEYEKYVGKSVEALRNVLSGDESALKDFEKFSEKASSISDKISKRSNSMSTAQLKRYLHILGNTVTGIF